MRESITPITKALKKAGLVRVTFTKKRFWERGQPSSLYDVPKTNEIGFSISNLPRYSSKKRVVLQVENAIDYKAKQVIFNRVIEVLDANDFKYEKQVHLGNIHYLTIDKV